MKWTEILSSRRLTYSNFGENVARDCGDLHVTSVALEAVHPFIVFSFITIYWDQFPWCYIGLGTINLEISKREEKYSQDILASYITLY